MPGARKPRLGDPPKMGIIREDDEVPLQESHARDKFFLTPELAKKLNGDVGGTYLKSFPNDGWVTIFNPPPRGYKYWPPEAWDYSPMIVKQRVFPSEYTRYIIDFRSSPNIAYRASGHIPPESREYIKLKGNKASDPIGYLNKPRDHKGRILTNKQINIRKKRAQKRLAKAQLTPKEYYAKYSKPVEKWDLEELARGRPRNKSNNFSGVQRPKWVPQEVHEEALSVFQNVVKTNMNVSAIHALEAIKTLLENDEYDDRGRPLVSPSTKLDASKYLLDHVVGKPKQHVQNDISIKLQSILGVVMGNPNEAFSMELGNDDSSPYQIGHMPGITMPIGIDEPIDAEIIEDEDE